MEKAENAGVNGKKLACSGKLCYTEAGTFLPLRKEDAGCGEKSCTCGGSPMHIDKNRVKDKTMMNRRAARELALRLLFEMDFTGSTPSELLECLTPERFTELKAEDALYTSLPDDTQREYIATLLRGVYTHKAELDALVEKYAIGWRLNRISRMTMSVLRLSLCELQYVTDVPQATAIDEAVEFAKNYDSPEAGSFVNGILGSFVRENG